jgi:CrcB protein
VVNILAVALGAVLGANARYWLGVLVSQRLGAQFPFGTLVINLTGSFVIGLLHSTIGAEIGISDAVELFAITGFLGAYTTYSTFSFEAFTLLHDDEPSAAGTYVVASMAAGVILAAIGFGLGNLAGRSF